LPVYFDIAEEFWSANDLEADAQVQVELWRVVTDRLARKFIQLSQQEDEESLPQETLWDILERTAEQEDVVRWVKRFILTGQYRRAIDFAECVEEVIEKLPRDKRQTRGWTLGHTFSRRERTSWREFARIIIGQDLPKAIAELEETARELNRLLDPGGIPERHEDDFVGHPAEIRLRRVIGVTYGILGIGYAYQGQYRKASEAYSRALRYLRDTRFAAQQAVTLNDLSRALSEMGRFTTAIRICWNGLEVKQTLGAENPIAYSHNTLALIYNDAMQPNDAWPEAVKAVVYFRRLEDPRGLGLALLQLGEALRRLAFSEQPLIDSPEELLRASEDAILEALEIFAGSEEIMRRIEAELEIGCVYRGYLYHILNQSGADSVESDRWLPFRTKAIQHLNTAIELSETNNYPQHRLDAEVDLVWTYYNANDFEEAEALCDQILERMTNQPYIMKKGEPPPIPERISGIYVFSQLSKLWTVKGKIAFDRFQTRTTAISQESQDKVKAHEMTRTDPEAIQWLREAAEAFVLSLAYGRLFSVRSPGIGLAFDHLYNYLKTFNPIEMEMFYRLQRDARREYRVDDIRPETLADIEKFLVQSFGDYFPANLPEKG